MAHNRKTAVSDVPFGGGDCVNVTSRHLIAVQRLPVRRVPRLQPQPAPTPPSQPPRLQVNWSVLTAVITAGAAVAAVFYTGRSLDATRDQVVIAQRQNEVAQQGQYTDRYGKAVEQLDKAGADHLQGRLGGVYALERLARDSPRDQPTIIEVLSAFVRTTTPAPVPAQPSEPEPLPGSRAGVCPDQPVSSDVQAAITVLSRRKTENDNKTPVDLSGACLRNLNLRRADLANASLSGANLIGADLRSAKLQNTDFAGANLRGARFDVDLTQKMVATESFARILSTRTLATRTSPAWFMIAPRLRTL